MIRKPGEIKLNGTTYVYGQVHRASLDEPITIPCPTCNNTTTILGSEKHLRKRLRREGNPAHKKFLNTHHPVVACEKCGFLAVAEERNTEANDYKIFVKDE